MPNHQQHKQLRDALMSAFPERSLLEQLLYFELEKKLNQITQESNLQTIVFQLIQAAQAQGWLVELVRAARKENPGNLELAAIAQELLSSETPPIVLPKSINPVTFPEPSTQQQKILILAANPKNTSRLRLDEELREIEQGLQRAGQRERFEIKPALAVRSRDIHRSILDFKPSIVHFSGHGAGRDGLIFEDETGQAKLVDALALAKLFKLFANQVKCVVLNACYSEIQAKAIAQHIDYVIGMSQAVGDQAAIEFAVGFYDALGAGESIEFAYELGCTAVQIQGIPEELTPKLFDKKQFDLEFITPSPSALEPQFCDGNIAEGNFSFQEHITLARIPVWLSQESFTSILCKGIAGVEAKFFVPGCEFTKELLKVENCIIQPSKFWSEIRRFQEIDAGSPGTYRRFIFVATGISRDLEPLVHELRRVHNSQDVDEEPFTMKDNLLRDYVQIISDLKGTEKDAIFIFDKVIIDVDWNNVKTHGEAIFKQSLVDNLPEYDDLSNKILDNIYNHLVTFIQQCKNQNITRKEIETKLRDKIPSNQQPSLQPLLVYTATESEDKPDRPALRFDWAAFSGGETRAIAPLQEWNRLLIELQETRSWIEKYRNTKRIRLAGNRRLIPCLAIGSVFSAVRGYSIEMEHREEVWPTDAHPTHETPDYPLSHQIVGETGTRLVVSMSIGIRRDITSEVEANLEKYELTGTPLLHIRAEQPITSPPQINVAVGNIKKLIVDNLVRIGGKEIHLFFAGPAHLALFLGHRLDATAPITCYAWVATGQYTKTLQLFSGISK